MRRHTLALLVLVALLAGSAVAVSAQDDAASTGLVTEEVEPGVERVIRDDSGHDLDARHPTYRYDMDGILITPDGTVWLRTSYHDTDNDANPPGALVWALGQPETPQYAGDHVCFTGGIGVMCRNMVTGSETSYLTDTSINQVVPAPDGSWWAVGAHGTENGGLYRIVPD